MFRAIIAHHQELGTVCAAIRCVSCEVPPSVVYIAVMVLWWAMMARNMYSIYNNEIL
jgi:hypothetical protein